MEFAIHYSQDAAALVDAGRITVDRFKCPAWPDLIARVRARYPLYVHFPLRVGWGHGDAQNTETHQPADWHTVEAMLSETGTPFVNLHLEPMIEDHPNIPVDTTDPADVTALTDALIRDVRAVVERFGPERVIAENVPGDDTCLRPAYLPAVVHRVIEETGCGFLFDISHARRAARTLGMEATEYIAALPVGRIKEIHITGIQHFDDRWIAVLRNAGLDALIPPFAGQWQDHLPFTDADWAFAAWSLDQIRQGTWSAPWVIALEYGGVGPLWEAFTDAAMLTEQVPRLSEMIRTATVSPSDR